MSNRPFAIGPTKSLLERDLVVLKPMIVQSDAVGKIGAREAYRGRFSERQLNSATWGRVRQLIVFNGTRLPFSAPRDGESGRLAARLLRIRVAPVLDRGRSVQGKFLRPRWAQFPCGFKRLGSSIH